MCPIFILFFTSFVNLSIPAKPDKLNFNISVECQMFALYLQRILFGFRQLEVDSGRFFVLSFTDGGRGGGEISKI